MELNKNSTATKKIVHFNTSEEDITLIVRDGNYIKIMYSTNKVPNSEPASYKNGEIYTNYGIDQFTELLNN